MNIPTQELDKMYNFTLISCVCTSLPAGKARNDDAGDYKQRRAAAKPPACHTHSMHRRRSASYFGICDSRSAISAFMPNSHAVERRNSRRNTATWTQFSSLGASVVLCPQVSTDQGQIWHARQSRPRYRLSCQILQ